MVAVLVTGAAGRVASALRDLDVFAGYAVRLVDLVPIRDPKPGEVAVESDLSDPLQLQALMEGVDVVVHLAGIADEADFDSILEHNIRTTYNVFEAARNAGVRRLVYASSNHVTGMYPTDVQVDSGSPVRPDSLYGVSKVFGEAVARLYHDKWGLEVVCIRIGSMRSVPEDRRQLRTWLSHGDAASLFRAAIEGPQVGFVTVYGVSSNAEAWWPDETSAQLGVTPLDDSEAFRTAVAHLHAPEDDGTLQGGAYADPAYRGGYR
jgi:uronate dehydrogenase